MQLMHILRLKSYISIYIYLIYKNTYYNFTIKFLDKKRRTNLGKVNFEKTYIINITIVKAKTTCPIK